ncbi:hypothetical protein LINPERPRIM_LOCUS8351 [Linum perenne]
MMREYRAQLDAERAHKLAHGRNHSNVKSTTKKDKKEKDSKKQRSKKRKERMILKLDPEVAPEQNIHLEFKLS